VNFKGLKRRVDAVAETLQECAEAIKDKSAFSKAFDKCKHAQHSVGEMQMELQRVVREFKETEELMK